VATWVFDLSKAGKKERQPPMKATKKKAKRKSGVRMIEDERIRQIRVKGYTAEHDDAHEDGSIRAAALAILYRMEKWQPSLAMQHWTDQWPMLLAYHVEKKHKAHVRRLAIAGALIAAEIDRLNRL
jgi:hypothetical protein